MQLNQPGRYIHLDALRALAAFLVLTGHVRGFVIVDFASATDVGLLARAVYVATSFAHQAVIVFFALSGFLIGGQVLVRMRDQSFSWRLYALRRITRLWIVVIPALALTLAFDRIGMTSAGAAGYAGEWYGLLSSGPDAPVDHSLGTFLGNVAFLQTISVPVFGSNGPLWSLANEFWYYLAFPLVASAVLLRRPAPWRLLFAVAGIGLLVWLPLWLLELGLVWIAGAAFGWFAAEARWAGLFATWYARAIAVLLAAAALAYGRFGGSGNGDLVLGLAIAACLPVLALLPAPRSGLYALLAQRGAAISYTLYLTHFPLLALICFALIAPSQWAMDLPGIAIAAGLTGAALLWAALVWWCFERHTDTLYGWLVGRVGRRPAAQAA